MERNSLSVCLVVRDEEKHLERCLASVRPAADEIIVVDTGSTDRTLEIANKFTEKLIRTRWRDDFSQARNLALDHARGDWVLFIDGDEELNGKSLQPLEQITADSRFEGYLVKVLNYFETGSQIETAPDVVFRLFRNRPDYRYSGTIHEQICDNILAANPAADIGMTEDICLIHYGYLKEEVTAKKKGDRNTRLLEKAVQKNPASLLDRFHLGVEYFRSNRHDRALREFLFVLDKMDLQAIYAPKLMRYITKCHYLLGNLEDALRFIENVWGRHFSSHGDLYYLKGTVCRDLGFRAQAYAAFQQCLEVPAQPAYYANLYSQYRDKSFLHLGELAEYFADPETALEHYVAALRENPRQTRALARIIAILKPRENPEYTLTALNRVFDLTDPGIQADLGHIFFAEQAYDLAVSHFEAAEAQGPVSVQTLLVKGLALLRTGHLNPAAQVLEQIPPGTPFYTAAQANLLLFYWLHRQNRKAATCARNLKRAGTGTALSEVLNALRKGKQIGPHDLKAAPEEAEPVVREIFERLIEFGDLESFNDAWDCLGGLFPVRPTQLLADLYFKYGHFDRAETEYRRLSAGEPVDAQVFWQLGRVCRIQEKLAEAEEFYQKALHQGLNPPPAEPGVGPPLSGSGLPDPFRGPEGVS